MTTPTTPAQDASLALSPLLASLHGLALRHVRVFFVGLDAVPVLMLCLSGLELAQLDRDADRQGILGFRAEDAAEDARRLGAASRYAPDYEKYSALQVARTLVVPTSEAHVERVKAITPATADTLGLDERDVRRLTDAEQEAAIKYLRQLPPPVLTALTSFADRINTSHVVAVGKGSAPTSASSS